MFANNNNNSYITTTTTKRFYSSSNNNISNSYQISTISHNSLSDLKLPFTTTSSSR